MISTFRLLTTVFTQRLRALREDRGASTIEYLILVLLGIGIATAAALVINNVASSKTADRKSVV